MDGSALQRTCWEAERMHNHDSKRAAIIYGACAAVWIGVLFFFSGQTGSESGKLSEKVTRIFFGWLIDRGADFGTVHLVVRKLAHAGIFAVEGWLLGSALLRCMRVKPAAALTAVVCAGIAGLNELHQLVRPDRSAEFRDVLIDTGGALAGLAFAVAVLHAFSAFKHRKSKEYITTQIYNNR